MSALAGWPHEAELRALVQRCCDHRGISVREFDRSIELCKSAPQNPRAVAEITALIQIVEQAFTGAHGAAS